jgi:hypothetical protein
MARPEADQDPPRPETDDIDFEWDETFEVRPVPANSGSEPPPHPRSGSRMSVADPVAIDDAAEQNEPRPREAMITLPDDDPLRHDVGYAKDRDVTRDSMPTIPDINPLRHDVPELSQPELSGKSSSAGGRGRA